MRLCLGLVLALGFVATGCVSHGRHISNNHPHAPYHSHLSHHAHRF